MEENLFFNILTVDWPKEPVTLYFSETGERKPLYFTQFPNEIESILPGIKRNSNYNVHTSYDFPAEGFKPLQVNFQTENPDLIKKFYERNIKHYFRKVKQEIVTKGFINEIQVWVKSKHLGTSIYDVYETFSLKVQIATVSKFPEILLSYDGQSKISKKSVAELVNIVSPTCFNTVLSGNDLWRWGKLQQFDDYDAETSYPVINKKLEKALNIPFTLPPRDNRYIKYLKYIEHFYAKYLDQEEFRKIIPVRYEGFLRVNEAMIGRTSEDSNQLLFGNHDVPDSTPKYALKRLKPYKNSPYPNIHLFFIAHENDTGHANTIRKYLTRGLGSFEGIQNYVNLTLHNEQGFSIVFHDKNNPIPEIEGVLSSRSFNPEIKYIAIYVTPFSQYEKDEQKREIYYRLKEILLKRRITSQVIDATKMLQAGQNWQYSLPNIAVAMLAKLDGIPWRLNTPVKNELVVGVGAFLSLKEGVQYIGSAFSFANDGKFNRFEYFLKDEIDILAGSIASAVKQYATVNAAPDRLIIHFYKTMSEEEIMPIQKKLEDLDLPIPVFIITINKTESEDIIAFDSGWEQLMPLSGRFIRIGTDKYLLFNNTRYIEAAHSRADGYPFPIKLKLQCTEPELLKDVKTVKELIDQVYQFSRMYWKSIRQQNLPVTIKYPEMVAKIAPHFVGGDIPTFGKNSLWFL